MRRTAAAAACALCLAVVADGAPNLADGAPNLADGAPNLQVRGTVSLSPPVLPPDLVRKLDPIVRTLWSSFDERRAMQHVAFVSQFWRLAGNPGFDATIDRTRTQLLASGFSETHPNSDARQPAVWIEEYPNTSKGWSYSIGTLAIVRAGQPEQVVLSREKQSVALCINSFSTPAGGVVAPLVDVGSGATDAEYSGKNLKGAVVLGDAPAATLWRYAVAGYGATGIVSTQLGDEVSPDPPAAPATPRDRWEILQWGSIPYDEARRPFGFKSSPRAAATLRQALAEAAGQLRVHVTIASSFSTSPVRSLIAEIPGRTAPQERIVLAAHVQEPGANDNASGVATLGELARTMALGIRSGRISAPGRTLTFLWIDEISGSRQWLRDHAGDARNVKYMFSLDMTGENVRKTGGTFLIERWPDPAAVWDRPWDPHTEWGRGDVRAEQLTGDLLNDLHWAVCERVARRTGWVVKTNPYEGGSDHTVFGTAGVPSVLDWHFTDRYYHSNLDTLDKTSAAEMRNVAVSVGASAWLLASATEADARAVASLVADAGRHRRAIEEQEGTKLATAAADPRIANLRQAEIVAVWRKWYAQAVRSTSRLLTGQPSAAFTEWIERLAKEFER